MKSIYHKPTPYILLNGKKLKTFPLRSGTRKGCLLYSFHLSNKVFNTKVLAIAIRKVKEIKGTLKEVKLPMFAYGMMLCMKTSTLYQQAVQHDKPIQ